MRACLAICTVAACTSPKPAVCEPPVALAAAGPIRSGIVYSGAAFVAKTPDAVAATACAQVDWLAGDASISTTADLAPKSTASVWGLAPDGAGGVYVGLELGSAAPQLLALAADGTQRWSLDNVRGTLFAGAEGPYVWSYASPPPGTALGVTAFAPDGTMRWTQTINTAPYASMIVPRATGGFFVQTDAQTIARFDASGTMMATTTIALPPGQIGNFPGFGSTDDGGLAVLGYVVGQVTIDAVTLTSPPSQPAVYVGVVDDAAVRWAYVSNAFNLDDLLSTIRVNSIRSFGTGLVVAAQTTYGGAMAFGLPPDPTVQQCVALYTPTAFDHAVGIGGPASEIISGLDTASDGSLWVAVDTSDPIEPGATRGHGSSGLTIGSATYTNANDDARAYVVNLAP